LASLLLQQRQPVKALEIIDELLKEIRKLDDKQMLTECHLTESRIYHALQNIPKCMYFSFSFTVYVLTKLVKTF